MATVRKDKMLAGYNGNLESVKIHGTGASTTEVEVTNGVFVVIGGLLEGERETKKANLAVEADVEKDVFLIHNSEVMYDERLHKLKDFRIKAGKVARAYRLYDGDIITLTADLFSGTVAVGDQLVVKASGLIGKPVQGSDAGASVIASAKVVFTVIENCGKELDIDQDSFAVQVSRN